LRGVPRMKRIVRFGGNTSLLTAGSNTQIFITMGKARSAHVS
jgi:hypothetical protein